jgi:hypothetical protein
MAKRQKVTALHQPENELAFDPVDPIARQCHPLYEGQYQMPTQSIANMAKIVALWMRKGITGGTIVGESNYGKTEAIKYIRRIRRELLGPGVAVTPIPMTKLPDRKRIFWQYVASKLGFAKMSSRPVEIDMLNKSIAGLLRVCEESRANRMVLFLDDAQYMTHEYYLDLKPIYDALVNEHGKRVVVVSVGENALTNFVKDMKAEGKTAINRFLRMHGRFSGVSSSDQLEEVLGSYDSILQFPVGSGRSYTESLLPTAFGGGFRLKALAHVTMDRYKTLITNKSDFDNQVMSMKTSTVFAQSLLDSLADIDCKNLVVEREQIDQALGDAIGVIRA